MELPRGMKDFESAENANIEHVRSHFKKLSNLYGFSFMDPSPIELLSTLETKSGPAIRDEIYYFRDKGDRDQTVENKARIAAMQMRKDDFEERLAGVEAAPTNGVVETQYNIRM